MDQDEILAIYDSEGRRIGEKPRSEVHRDHDWHMLAFVWAARIDTDRRRKFLLQLRGRIDDPHLGHVDALSGGHVSAQEEPFEGALRECTEETGLVLPKEDLIFLGSRMVDCQTGVCRRAIEYFYLSPRAHQLTALEFGDDVTGFVEVDLDEFAELIDGQRTTTFALTRRRETGKAVHEDTISNNHIREYSREILDGFRLSLRAIKAYLESGVVEHSIWQ